MGAPSITYEAPKVEKDKTFEKLMQYQLERQLDLDQKALKSEDRQIAQERGRRETGALGFDAYADRIASQVKTGITPYNTAEQLLQNYVSDYKLDQKFMPVTETRTKFVYQDILDDEGKPTGEKEKVEQEYEYTMPGATPGFTFDYQTQVADKLSGLYDEFYGTRDAEGGFVTDPLTGKVDRGIRGKQFEAGVQKAYQDLFGRDAKADELTEAFEEFDANLLTDYSSFKADLKDSEAYRKKFNDNYFDNYYDMLYGSSVEDRIVGEGDEAQVTKLRNYAFDASMMPTVSFDLEERTGITLPDYETYFKEGRSVAELEDQRQSIAQSRDFIYQSGLKNLEGEIQKENNKIMIEGKKDLAKIDQATSAYSSLIGSFNF
jgi:hypothetical protein